jgi:hypothetical protein
MMPATGQIAEMSMPADAGAMPSCYEVGSRSSVTKRDFMGGHTAICCRLMQHGWSLKQSLWSQNAIMQYLLSQNATIA